MNAITTTAAQPLAYNELERLASDIARSNLFGIKTKEQAMVLMMISHAEGRHPALAARDFDIINGRPAKKAEAMLRDFLQAGGKVEWHALTDEAADATFTHPQTGSVRIDWNMERAKVAGFAGKDMYKKFPRQMLRSRVISEGVRTLWPLATSGMYVEAEITDMAPAQHNGPTIEAEPGPYDELRQQINNQVPLTRPVPLNPTPRPAQRAAAAATPAAPVVRAPAETPPSDAYSAPDDPLAGELGYHWLQALRIALRDAGSLAEVERIGGHPRVNDAISDQATPPKVRTQITELLADAYARHAQHNDEPLPEVEIAGADKVLAG